MTTECKWKILHIFHRLWRKTKVQLLKEMLNVHHKNVSIPHSIKLYGHQMQLGNNVCLGEENLFMCVNAPIIMGDHIMLGPRVTMITGDHRIDVVGKYMTEVGEVEKHEENDQPIILEEDNWIGANVTILKGVTIGKGAVVAAGALVIQNVPPYAIVGGCPTRVLRYRFGEIGLEEHKRILKTRFGD